MSWRHAFGPWGSYEHTQDVADFIDGFGLNCYTDGDERSHFIDSVNDASGDCIYDRDDDDWEELSNYLPSGLITLLDAVNWCSSSSKPKLKTRVGSMAKLPLP